MESHLVHHLLICLIYSVAAPMVTMDPSTPAATIGRPLMLTCSANDCIVDSFTFDWRFNGQPVSSDRVRLIDRKTSQLTIDSVTTADYGSYACQVTNEVDTTIGTFTVVEAGMFVKVHCM